MKNQPLNENLFQIIRLLPDNILLWCLNELSDEDFPLWGLEKRSADDKATAISNAITAMKHIDGLTFTVDMLGKVVSITQPQQRQQPQQPSFGTVLQTIDNGPIIGENLAGKC